MVHLFISKHDRADFLCEGFFDSREPEKLTCHEGGPSPCHPFTSLFDNAFAFTHAGYPVEKSVIPAKRKKETGRRSIQKTPQSEKPLSMKLV